MAMILQSKAERRPKLCCNGQPVTASHHLIGQSTSVCNSRRASDPQACTIRAICYSARQPVYYSPVIKLGLCRPGRHLVLLLDSELYTQISKKCQARNTKSHYILPRLLLRLVLNKKIISPMCLI